jgi:hypothetical protein
MGSGIYVYGGKKGGVEKKKKKKLKGNGAKYRIVKIYLEDVFDIFYHKGFVYISIAHTIHISLYFFYYIIQIL